MKITQNGGPAPEKVTAALFAATKSQTSYPIVKSLPDVSLSVVGDHSFSVSNGSKTWTVKVSVINAVKDYCELMTKV